MNFKYWLANITELHNQKKKLMIDCDITPEKLFYMSEAEMEKISFLTKKDISVICKKKGSFDIDKEWEKFVEMNISFVTIGEKRYPKKLLNIDNPPYALFYIGELPDENKKSVAIVGARGRSAYGCQIAQKLGEVLAKNDIQVISGMARGIDRDSHMGALEANGKTYAVLGCGADVCYPKENRFLYDRISNEGAVISEVLPKTQPLPMFFPLRNRIISGLSDLIVVVEAREKSGSLITADYAMEQGKDVYVVPGRITDELSKGCNRLIKQGAGIIYNIDEFVSDITMTRLTECTQIDFRKNLLDKKESLVYSLLDFCPIALGTLLDKVPYDLAELIGILEALSQKGFVEEVVSNYFVKKI